MLSRLENSEASRHIISQVEVAWELLKMLKNPSNAEHVMVIGKAIQGLKQPNIAEVLFEIVELAEGFADRAYELQIRSEIEASLREIMSEDNMNPETDDQDSEVLDRISLPILEKMVEQPSNSPQLFVDLCHVLNNQINIQELSVWAAAEELGYTLDRPEIMQHPQLQKAITKGLQLELPRTIRQQDPVLAWHDFMRSLPKSKI
jgi:hypothetical protein